MNHDEIARAAVADGEFEIDGERFVLSDLFPTGGQKAFSLIKPPSSIAEYLRLLSELPSPLIVEIGIAYGGSTAFLALAADPQQLVAIDISTERVVQLDEMIERHDLGDRVHLHFDVDQADAGRVRSLVDDAVGVGEQVDLVIDDGSHMFEQTLTSFNELFPRVRPGGLYVIEDWACDHRIADLLSAGLADSSSREHQWAIDMMAGRYGAGKPGQRPLATVAAETMGAPPWSEREQPTLLSRVGEYLFQGIAAGDPSIDALRITDEWIVVTKGEDVERDGYDLAKRCRAAPLICQPGFDADEPEMRNS